MDQELIRKYRSFLRDTLRKKIDFSKADQQRGVAPPALEKPFPEDARPSVRGLCDCRL